MLTDTHTHLNHPDLDNDGQAVLRRAHDAGVSRFIVVGYDLPSSRRAAELAQEIPGAWAVVGIHPHDASLCDGAALEELAVLADAPRVAAIGEVGLDYYRDLSPRDAQRRAFQAQVELARQKNMPVVVHSRDAAEDVFEMLAARAQGLKVVLHCFAGSLSYAEKCLEAGFFLGIGGPLTYKKNVELQEIVRRMPLGRLLLETDAPYLAPHPYRGRRNEPAYVRLVAEKAAELRGVSPEEIADQTTSNAASVFFLD
ncbi:MAG: TatD family hydrolase [Armatimonadetes bacterium]|nr:TatD family hydrolase [Armatimonadota bacterium]